MVIDDETRVGRVSILRGRHAVAAALVVSFVAACGSPPPPEKKPEPVTAEGVARYLPLEDETVFSYETRMEPGGERGLLVLEVRRRRPELAELVVAGRSQRLNVTATSIELVTGGALLRAPLSMGATWRGDFGRVRVTDVSRSVTVPAGAFSGCVETVEEMTSAEGTKRTSTVFCPGVGIALRETEVEQDGVHATDRIELKSFGKRFSPGEVSR
jgi:hypothetical protein